MKNVLFISYDGMTDPLGQSQVIPYLKGLTKYNYRFTILSCEKTENFARNKNIVETQLKSYPIKWVFLSYHKKPPVFSGVYDVLMLKRKAKKLHEKEKFDLVHTRSGIPSLIGLWMKKKLGIKFLNDVREFYADSRVDGNMWNLKNPFYKLIYNFFKKKEEDEVKNSDGMVCLTFAAEKIIRQWPQYQSKNILEVIPCSVDINLFDPEKIDQQQQNLLKKELNIEDGDFVISYLGSLGGWYLTDEMMHFFKNVADKISNAKFLFISPHKHEMIYNTAAKFGIRSKKIIVKSARRDEVPLLLSLSKYSVFFIKPCYSKKSSSPTRHGEIMAMGIPLITNCGIGDVAEIVKRYNSGVLIKDLNQENYSRYSEMIEDIPFDSQKIRDGAKEYYSLEIAVKKYAKVYQSILK